METLKYPVHVTADVARASGIPHEGDKNYKIGECEATTYEFWDEVPEEKQSAILVNANRQAIQDAMNSLRAAWKDERSGGVKMLKRERDELTAERQTLFERLAENDTSVVPQITELTGRIQVLMDKIGK